MLYACPLHWPWESQVIWTGCSGSNPGRHLYVVLEEILYFNFWPPTICAFGILGGSHIISRTQKEPHNCKLYYVWLCEDVILQGITYQNTVVLVSICLVYMWPLMLFYDIQAHNCKIFFFPNSDLHQSNILGDTHAVWVELHSYALKQDAFDNMQWIQQ